MWESHLVHVLTYYFWPIIDIFCIVQMIENLIFKTIY
jgi:hypothetical protein